MKNYWWLGIAMSQAALAGAPQAPAAKWDAWYTVKAEDTIPYAYYNEKFDTQGGRTRLQIHIWKKEQGFINQEILGEFAKQGPELVPLFYNYRQIFQATETTIDGTINEHGQLTAKAREGSQDLPVVQKQIPPKTILSYMFPAWLAQRLSHLKQDEIVSFYAFAEDRVKDGFPMSVGEVTLLKPDEIAAKTHTQKIRVNFDDAISYWWVKKDGMAVAIDTPARKVLVQLATKPIAEKFLK